MNVKEAIELLKAEGYRVIPPMARNQRHVKVLDLRAQGKTFREIGDELHVTPERARQIFLAAEKRR